MIRWVTKHSKSVKMNNHTVSENDVSLLRAKKIKKESRPFLKDVGKSIIIRMDIESCYLGTHLVGMQ
ncbi:hypothetical protein BpHYR1_015737 [Brachionus plicatilis]|uniref:Uncharacterized protein n=1 Tax=Brachionus plicatilis TaxID=10195 RepID=A0A3M7RKA0_BRAPC|nr:hypothetical protein BpHYR1_015737 [Brachionus plicatilis]